MSGVKGAHAARRDYRHIVEWLRDRNPSAALRMMQAIDRGVEVLMTMPRLGRAGRLDGTRELGDFRHALCRHLSIRCDNRPSSDSALASLGTALAADIWIGVASIENIWEENDARLYHAA